MQHRFAIDRRRHFVHILLMGVVAMAGLYLLLTGVSLAYMAERQSLLSSINDARTRLSGMESAYLMAAKNITPALIAERGFTIPPTVHFVTRRPLGQATATLTEL